MLSPVALISLCMCCMCFSHAFLREQTWSCTPHSESNASSSMNHGHTQLFWFSSTIWASTESTILESGCVVISERDPMPHLADQARLGAPATPSHAARLGAGRGKRAIGSRRWVTCRAIFLDAGQPTRPLIFDPERDCWPRLQAYFHIRIEPIKRGPQFWAQKFGCLYSAL